LDLGEKLSRYGESGKFPILIYQVNRLNALGMNHMGWGQWSLYILNSNLMG